MRTKINHNKEFLINSVLNNLSNEEINPLDKNKLSIIRKEKT